MRAFFPLKNTEGINKTKKRKYSSASFWPSLPWNSSVNSLMLIFPNVCTCMYNNKKNVNILLEVLILMILTKDISLLYISTYMYICKDTLILSHLFNWLHSIS